MPVVNRLTLRQAGVLLAALVAVIGLAVELRSNASAQDPSTRTITFKELAKGSTSTHIRNTDSKFKYANLQGDLNVFTNQLTDAAAKSIGRLHVSCTTTTGSRNFAKSVLMCVGVFSFHGGTLTVQALSPAAASTITGAVTGGTGAYANAHGVFVSKHGKDGADDTIKLVG